MSVRLNKIVPSKVRKNSFELYFENDEKLICTAAEAADFALYGEKELSEEEYLALKSACELRAVKEKAAELLSYRAMSAGELKRKLIDKGKSDEFADVAVQWLKDMGALDELEYAKSIVRHYSGKGWGVRRIKDEFYRRSIPREYWEEAFEEFDGEAESIERFLEKRLALKGDDPDECKKAAQALYRRGFSWEQIKKGMLRYTNKSYEDDC